MKLLTLYIVVVTSAIAGTQSSTKEAVDSNKIYVPADAPGSPKFFKASPKICVLAADALEESLKVCIKPERRWLHI